MERFSRFMRLKTHPLLGVVFARLTIEDLVFARDFLLSNEEMSGEDFGRLVLTSGEFDPSVRKIELRILLTDIALWENLPSIDELEMESFSMMLRDFNRKVRNEQTEEI